MDRDEVFGLRDYRNVWKQVILVVLYEFKSVTTQLCYVSFGTQSVKVAKRLGLPDPDGRACSSIPPCVCVWGGGGGGGGVSLAHPHKTLAEKRGYCRNHDIVSK